MTIGIVYLLLKFHTIPSKDIGGMNIFLPIQLTSTTYYVHMYIGPDVELCSALGWDLDLPRLSSYVSRARPVGTGPYHQFLESREPSSHGRPAGLTLFRF